MNVQCRIPFKPGCYRSRLGCLRMVPRAWRRPWATANRVRKPKSGGGCLRMRANGVNDGWRKAQPDNNVLDSPATKKSMGPLVLKMAMLSLISRRRSKGRLFITGTTKNLATSDPGVSSCVKRSALCARVCANRMHRMQSMVTCTQTSTSTQTLTCAHAHAYKST